jgi:hypothetical protein
MGWDVCVCVCFSKGILRKENAKNVFAEGGFWRNKLTATAVPGRKSMVRTAMVRMAALSRIVASAIWRADRAISKVRLADGEGGDGLVRGGR